MNTKKLLKALSIFIMFMLPSFMDAASFSYTYKGIEFQCEQKNGKVTVIAFDKNASKVVVPSNVKDKRGNSYPVYSIDFFSEIGGYKTNTIAIEKGVTEISEFCFYNFRELQLIYIPVTIEKIGKKAFNSKYMPTFKMPSTINEEDLRNGLAIYPKVETADPMDDIDMSVYDPGYNPNPVTIVDTPSNQSKGITPGTSDVDYNIPTTGAQRENTFCIIIANENYTHAPKVDYASVDGSTFKRYCTNTLGIPNDNIRMVTNANYLNMQEQFDWIKKVSDVFGNDANFIVYYAGHGIPSDDGSCYLLPVDGNPTKANNGYSLKKLYDLLGSLTTQSALVLIDACFSGNDRKDLSMLGNDRGIVRRIKEEKVAGNVVVMSAASNTETALPYEEKGHGMFTYFLLKKLQESKGKLTYGQLYDYVKQQVTRRTTVSKNKTQTPSVTCSSRIAGSWKSINF